EEDGQWFFTMELLQGVDWVEYVRPGFGSPRQTVSVSSPLAAPLDPFGVTWVAEDPDSTMPAPAGAGNLDVTRFRQATAQLARGLYALHRANKVHCDIKPGNIRVSSEGRVVLLDFGLVKDLQLDELSPDGALIGTVEYMAPEQAAGQTVGPAADWYSVGVLIYQALTGRLPFQGKPTEVLERKRSGEAAPPIEGTCAPPELAELCMQLLHPDPKLRPGAREVLDWVAQRRQPRPVGGR